MAFHARIALAAADDRPGSRQITCICAGPRHWQPARRYQVRHDPGRVPLPGPRSGPRRHGRRAARRRGHRKLPGARRGRCGVDHTVQRSPGPVSPGSPPSAVSSQAQLVPKYCHGACRSTGRDSHRGGAHRGRQPSRPGPASCWRRPDALGRAPRSYGRKQAMTSPQSLPASAGECAPDPSCGTARTHTGPRQPGQGQLARSRSLMQAAPGRAPAPTTIPCLLTSN